MSRSPKSGQLIRKGLDDTCVFKSPPRAELNYGTMAWSTKSMPRSWL